MVQVTITIDKNQIGNLSNKMPQLTKRIVELTSAGLIGDLTTNSPVDEGLLRQWFISSKSDDEIQVQTPAQYARYVNDGTGIYNGEGLIYPSGKALKFKPGKKWDGPVSKDGFVYLKYSRGQKGQKFVEKSIESTKTHIQDYFKIAISEVMQ